MELRHLRYFVAVAETRHFGRAAERLHMAQPALSQSIRQLEKELGSPLFTRTTRQVSLTPAGEFLHGEAQRVLAAVDDSVRGVQRIADGRMGLVRIAFTGTAAFTHLPRIARTLTRDLPDIALEIHADLLTPAQSTGLHEGRLDLGVMRSPASDDGLSARTIEIEPLVLAVAADHPLAGQPMLSVSDLRNEAFIMYADSDSAVNEAVARSCQEAGFTPQQEHVASGTAVLLALVSAGLGIALVPGSVRAVPLPDVAFREIDAAATIELVLAWVAESPSTLVQTVVACLDAAGLFADSPTVPAPSPEVSP